MAFGEDVEDPACSGTLAFVKAERLMVEHPDVVGLVRERFRWVDGCRFAMNGSVDLQRGSKLDRRPFELIVALDPKRQVFRQDALSMPD